MAEKRGGKGWSTCLHHFVYLHAEDEREIELLRSSLEGPQHCGNLALHLELVAQLLQFLVLFHLLKMLLQLEHNDALAVSR